MKLLLLIVVGNLFFVRGEVKQKPTRKTTTKWHKPEEGMKTCELVSQHGYPCETHEVTTRDGYILELHRIPHGIHQTNETNQSKPVVFLQHGLVQSSSTWCINSPNKSLSYMLADRGYDVWIGNSRGNTYSYKHTMLHPSDELYWDFSWEEMAQQDLPAAIGMVLEKTGQQKLDYIGHSQGTTIGFAAFSSLPALARKIRLFIALAPVTHLTNIQGLFKLIASPIIFPLADVVVKLLGVRQLAPSSWVLKTIANVVCKGGMLRDICANVLFLATGTDTHNLDINRLSVYMSHTPSGTSVKDILHFRQMVVSGIFQKYDYGWNGNMRKYMQPIPPRYYVGDMRVPVAIFTGSYDWLATVQDVGIHLRHGLKDLVYFKNTKEWNHMDFVWGIHAKEILYEDIFLLLEGKTPEQL